MSTPRFPFHTLDARTFEELCADLLRCHFPLSTVELYGRSGQKQFGADVVAVSQRRVYALQCKAYQKFSAKEMAVEVEAFLASAERWRQHNVSHYVVCLAHDLEDAPLVSAWLEAQKRLLTAGFAAVVWSASTLQMMLTNCPRMVRDYIRDPAWRDLLLGSTGISTQSTLESQILSLSRADAGVAVRLQASPFAHFLEFVATDPLARSRNLLERTLSIAGKESATSLLGLEKQLTLATRFLEDTAVMSVWQTRRLLGKAVAVVMRRVAADKLRTSTIDQLAESSIASTDGSILLATALTADPRASVALGNNVIGRLLRLKHPQVRWLIARRWSMLRQALGPDKVSATEADIFAEEDDWLRRRWLLGLAQDVMASPSSETQMSSLLQAICRRESDTPIGRRFLSVLGLWISHNSDYSLPTTWDWDATTGTPIDNVVEAVHAFSTDAGVIQPEQLATIIDLGCMRHDTSTDDAAFTAGGRGRYAVIEDWVATAISRAPGSLQTPLVECLVQCADEGIRLAVATSARTWLTKLNDSGDAFKILAALVTDENAWVVRKGLELLFHHHHAVDVREVDRLLPLAKQTVDRRVRNGWPDSEFGIAGKMLLAGLTAPE